MNKEVREKVLAFMRAIDTHNLNTNNFVLDYYKYTKGEVNEYDIRNWVSFESISRSRRYRLAQEKLYNLNLWLSRDENSKDSEEEYKNTFTRTPIWMY